MKHITFLLFIVLVFVGCKNEEKKIKNIVEPIFEIKEENTKADEIIKKYNISKAEVNLLEDPNLFNVSVTSHSFEDDIVFDEINVLKTDENTYSLIFVINNEETDFNKLSKWKIGMYFFAKDPTKFENKTDAIKGYKTTGMLADMKMMDNDVVLVLEGFKIIPKEISLLRIYLYNSNNDMNKNYYNTKDFVLP